MAPQWVLKTGEYALKGMRWLWRWVCHQKNRFVHFLWREHLRKWFKYVFDGDYRFLKNSINLSLYKRMPDETFLKRQYRAAMGRELSLSAPVTLSEKLQWLKLYDRRPEYNTMVDKYAVKQWAAARIGEEYITPALGLWDRFDEIDFSALPDRFVLKCTHDSGSTVLIKDKNAHGAHFATRAPGGKPLSKRGVKRMLKARLKRNMYYPCREWAYRDVPPRILAEEYLTDEGGAPFEDYRVYNFNGEPRIVQVNYVRNSRRKRKLYTASWEWLDVALKLPSEPEHTLPRPPQLTEMLALARRLSQGIPFVRTDFYLLGGKLRLGEMTFFPKGGYLDFDPAEWDAAFGTWLTLPGQE